MRFKLILFLFLFLVFFSSVFSWNLNNLNGEVWSFDNFQTKGSTNLIIQNLVSNSSLELSSFNFAQCVSGFDCFVFIYPNSEDFVLIKVHYDVLSGGMFDLDFNFLKYYKKDLRTNQFCNPQIMDFDSINNKLRVNSNLNEINYFDSSIHFFDNLTLQTYIPDIESKLKKYYYMKSLVKINLFKDGTLIDSFQPDNLNTATNYPSHVLLKPNTNTFNFNLPTNEEIAQTYGAGNYLWNITIEPIDLKCDFDQNGTLSDTEREITTYIQYLGYLAPPGPSIQIFSTPSDNILGPNQQGLIEEGSFYFTLQNADSSQVLLNSQEVTLIDGNVYVNLENGEVSRTYKIKAWDSSDNEVNKTITFYLDSDGDGLVDMQDLPNSDSCPYHKNLGTDWNKNGIDDACDPKKDDVDIKFRQEFIEIICGPHPSTGGDEVRFYQDQQKIKYTGSHTSGYKIYIGDYGFVQSNREYYVNNDLVKSKLNSNNEVNLVIQTYVNDDDDNSFKSRGLCTLKYINQIELLDQDTLNKAICSESECRLSNTNEILTLPTTNENNIKIYKEGVLIREERPNPVTIALKGHKIQKYKTAEQANTFIEDTIRLMERFNITKHITYNQTTDKSKITLKLENIPLNVRKNITLYQVIPKEFANTLSQINISDDNKGQFIVLDKDPVIGWYFDESESEESVEYTLPGNNEGGTIIITQEPILFNEGELVINYRESNCNDGELLLFELDDLENSIIHPPNSGKLYKICIDHINDDVILERNNLNNAVHVFNYSTNFSLTQYTNSLDISTNNESIYWNIQFSQNNPDGTFSCLGSYNNKYSSTFGDCGYTTNRIWLHLGADFEPPKTNLVYPFLAHKMKFKLDADDGYGSGVKQTYYCIGENCEPTKEYTKGEDIYIECPNQWGCVKTIRYYSIDNQGNKEQTIDYKLTLIDQGSACQADCTAKPTPNRIIKDCINLNGCKFYGETLEEQINISKACHYLTSNTWVPNPYNPNEEILCPSGPSRKAQFTKTPLNFWTSICDNIQTTKYPVIIDGKQVNMVFVYCENY